MSSLNGMQFASNVQDDSMILRMSSPRCQWPEGRDTKSRGHILATFGAAEYIVQALLTTYAYNGHLDRRSSRRFASHYGKKGSKKLSSKTHAAEDPA